MRKSIGIAAAGVVAIGFVVAATLVSERATVVVSIPAQPVHASLDLTGGPAEGDLPTQHLVVRVTDTLAGTASPAMIASAFATGEVVFTYYSQCTRECGGIVVRVPAGADVSTAAGVHYTTLADTGTFFPTSRLVPVRAAVAGSSGNSASGAIVRLGSVPTDMGVTNPKPITGGAERQTHIVSQADYTAVERAVVAEVIGDARLAMRTKAAGLGYAVTGPATLTEKSSDHVGAETESFTVTITATLEAYAFFDSAIRGHLTSAVVSRVRPDQELTRDSIEVDYEVASVTRDGEILIHATGTGFVVPRVPEQELRSRLAGMNPALAREVVRSALPDASASFRMWPVALPWLPIQPANIAFSVEVLPSPA